MSADALSTPRRSHLVLALLLLVFVVIAALAAGSTGSNRPNSAPGRVLWNGDLSTGDLGQYEVQDCADDRTTVVRDPRGLDRNAIRFTVRNSDVSPCTPSDNP